ncbi:terminase [Sporosarcina sp. P12(2017)]|uniref:terminase small subunit n=1 Tax=unclassified Sporosarcina TaxID=2647733 RepID=UPI000C16E7E1|nr:MULTISPECIES: terminase small subunit [unclassified Sporosarcina]PIC59092.1 terminase [Sporosarcina sp. P10]PIC62413.1 terminase [Sporosarcina sp. P12(2017)]
MSNWGKIQKEWETTKITLSKLAEKHDVKLGTLKSRKSRESWVRGPSNKEATRKKKVATPSKRMQPKKKDKEPVVESDSLTDKQRLFCIYYIKYFNATKAYQKAYGCAYTTAMVEGHGHLRNPKISAEIDRMRNDKLSEKKLSLDDVLQKYIDIAFADISDFMTFGSEEVVAMDEYGKALLDDKDEKVTYMRNYVTFMNSDEVDGTIITEVKQGKDGVSVKLADKMKALDMLAKYTDLLSAHDKKRLEEEKMKVDIEKAHLELGNLRGDTEGDPHAQGSSYEDALNAQTEDVFADEVMDDET